MKLRFFRRFGICLFSIITAFAVGLFPTASAHYNGDHIDFETSGGMFILSLIPTPVIENVPVYTNSSGQRFLMKVGYNEGTNGSTNLYQRYIGGENGSQNPLSAGRYWSVTVKLPYIGGVMSRADLASYVENTGFLAITFEFDMSDDQTSEGGGYRKVVPDTVTRVNGASFAVTQTVGDMKRYTWVYEYENGVIPSGSLIDLLLSGTTPNVDGDVPFPIPFYTAFECPYDHLCRAELFPFMITNNPDGVMLPEADDTTIIVEGLENLGDAIDTSIAAGVEEINSVVLQQTNEITGSIESQTEAILNYRSDVDMSISQNAEVATKLAEESLINQQIYDGYVTPEYDTNVGDTIDQNFGDGVGFLSDAMQMIFDFGVGNLVLVLLTIGTSLFIIGRSMR